MIFTETALGGAYLIRPDKKEDGRGFLARSFCEKEFKSHGLELAIRQASIVYNKTKGTLRGMHYQAAPHGEIKLVSCVRGAIYDVILDLRPDSPTYCKWFALELNDRENGSLYIPEGFAQGYQTLTDDTTVSYSMSQFYCPESARGVRWDDRSFNIKWPASPCVLSDKDANYPDYKR